MSIKAENTTLEEYSKIAANILIRNLKGNFVTYILTLLPPSLSIALSPLVGYLTGWVFDWTEKQIAFQAFCKYTDFRVAHQGSKLGRSIYSEIQAKKGGNKDEIIKSEKDTDKLFDSFVILSH
jgi:hypothetical protein